MSSVIEQVFCFLKRREDAFGVKKIKKSGNILPIDLEEMVSWIESLRAPMDSRFDTMNIVFHPLPSGHFALGRLRPVYSSPEQTSSYKVISQGMLSRIKHSLHYYIIDPDTLLLSGNNPIFLLRKLLPEQEKRLTLLQQDPASIEIETDSALFHKKELTTMSLSLGIDSLSALTDLILHREQVGFYAQHSSLHIISAVLSLLPLEERTEITFSAELNFTEDRYLRVSGFSRDTRIPAHLMGIVQKVEQLPLSQKLHGWGTFVRTVLQQEEYNFFEEALSGRQEKILEKVEREGLLFPSCAEELDRWGEILQEKIESKKISSLEIEPGEERPIFKVHPTETKEELPHLTIPEKLRRWLLEKTPKEKLFFDRQREFVYGEPLLVYEGQNQIFSPFQRLLALCPDKEPFLLELDARIAEALEGGGNALKHLQNYWKTFVRNRDTELYHNVQEEYIHFIRSTLLCDQNEDRTSADRTVAALDVLDLLLDDAALV